MVKRERIGGKLGDYEYMFVKLRHQPFSVYMYFLGPAELKGQEVIYVEGQNDGNMWAHGVGIKNTMFGTVSLKPDGPIAMRNQRYPLTELGILNLTRRLVEVGEQDVKYGECEVKFYEGAKINNRVCTCIEVVHPVPRRNFLFHLARIFVDEEFNLPIRYESYDWPKEKGGPPELIEEYTYLNLKLNNGFTDADFDIEEPELQVPLMRSRRCGDIHDLASPPRREVVAFSGRCVSARSAALVAVGAISLVVVAAMFLEDSLIFFPVAYPEGDWQPAGCGLRTPGSRRPTARGCTAGTCRRRTPGRRCSSATATAATSRIASTP